MSATGGGQRASANRFRKAGYWLDKTVDQLLAEAVAKAPDKISIVADRADRDQAQRLSYRELENRVARGSSFTARAGYWPR